MLGGLKIGVITGVLLGGFNTLVILRLVPSAGYDIAFLQHTPHARLPLPVMVPWFILQFVSSPVSMVMHVLQLQGEMLALTIFGLVCRVGGVALAAVYMPDRLIEAFAVSSALFYLVLLIVIVHRAGCRISHVAPILRNGSVSAICGGVAGAIFLAIDKLWS